MQSPGKIYPGTSLRRTINFEDASCDPVDPDTVTFKVYPPNGQISTYVYGTDAEVQRSAAGAYYADFIPDTSGRWHFRWETTGTGTTVTKEGSFVVQYSPFVEGQERAYT